MPKHTYDYEALEHRFITTELSIRTLAQEVGASNSTIADYARKHDWDRKRADYKTAVDRGAIQDLASTYLKDMAAIEGEFTLAFRHAIRAFVKDLNEGKIQVTVRDLALLVEKFNLLRGEATSRTESKNLDLHAGSPILALFDGAPDRVLRELADLAGVNGAGSQPVGRGPLVVLEGTSEEAVS